MACDCKRMTVQVGQGPIDTGHNYTQTGEHTMSLHGPFGMIPRTTNGTMGEPIIIPAPINDGAFYTIRIVQPDSSLYDFGDEMTCLILETVPKC